MMMTGILFVSAWDICEMVSMSPSQTIIAMDIGISEIQYETVNIINLTKTLVNYTNSETFSVLSLS